MNDQMSKEHEMCVSKYDRKCKSWTGIIAGALIAVGLSFLLSLFCAALGLSAFHTSAEGVTTIAIGGVIGMLIGIVAVMFFSGWVAGFLARKSCSTPCVGAIYGITAWCLALVITVVIATHTMEFVSANLYTITNHKITTANVFNNTATKVVANTEVVKPAQHKLDLTNINDEATTNFLALSLFLTFIMFFMGAIFSAIGGYCGAKSRCGCCCSKTDCNCGCGCCKP